VVIGRVKEKWDVTCGLGSNKCHEMMMIAFITIKSSLVPLIEGLCAHRTSLH